MPQAIADLAGPEGRYTDVYATAMADEVQHIYLNALVAWKQGFHMVAMRQYILAIATAVKGYLFSDDTPYK